MFYQNGLLINFVMKNDTYYNFWLGYTNLSTSSDRMLGQVVEPTDDVLAFDLSLPLVDANPGKSSPEPWMNPVELQQAMESAMSMGHEKYMRTVANYRPAQCCKLKIHLPDLPATFT